MNSTPDSQTCCICLSSLETVGLGRHTLPCGHVLHDECVADMRRYGASGRCPLCRESHDELTPVQKLIDQAVLHYKRTEYQECYRLISSAYDIDPANAFTNFLLGKMHLFGAGVRIDRAHAKDFLLEAVERGSLDAVVDLINVYQKDGDDQRSMQVAEQAHALGHVRATLRLGQMHFASGHIDKAKELFEQSYARGHPDAAKNLADVHFKQGNVYEAVQILEQAIGFGHAGAMSSLGMLLCKDTCCRDARRGGRLLMQAYQLGDGMAALAIGIVYKDMGDQHQAIEFWEEARTLAINHFDVKIEASVCLGDLHREQGRTRVAVEMYQEAAAFGHTGAKKKLAQMEVIGMLQPKLKGDTSYEELGANPNQFVVGQRVMIHSLRNPAAQPLNHLEGYVCRVFLDSGRIGVNIIGVGEKSIKSENLRLCDGKGSGGMTQPDDVDFDCQVALETSLGDASAMQLAAAATRNEEVSTHLHQNRLAREAGKHVIHLQFSRPCKALHDALMESDELTSCRLRLEAAGFTFLLGSGCKVFVKPEYYQAVLVAVQGQTLHARDVIVDPDLEMAVVQAASGIRKKNKVNRYRSQTIPLGFLLCAEHDRLEVSFKKRTINIKVPSSLLSSSLSDGPRTV